MASESSEELVLSMQQVSIQIYSKLSLHACTQAFMILESPFLEAIPDTGDICMSWNDASSSSQVWDKIA